MGPSTRVRAAFELLRGTAGYRRVAACMRDGADGVEAGPAPERRVRESMRRQELRARRGRRPRRAYNTCAGEVGDGPANAPRERARARRASGEDYRLAHDFSADRPGALLVTDATEIGPNGFRVYLSPVVDCWDGCPASCSISPPHPDQELCDSSLAAALALEPEGARPVVHTDGGARYRSGAWRGLCDAAGATRSMSRRGTCPDNARRGLLRHHQTGVPLLPRVGGRHARRVLRPARRLHALVRPGQAEGLPPGRAHALRGAGGQEAPPRGRGAAGALWYRCVTGTGLLPHSQGEVLGVLGPNGCGKSTLLGFADGLGMPARGTVLVGGEPVAAIPARERAGRIALLPQVHGTPSMQARDLVACERYAHMGPFGQLGEKDERAVDEAISLMGLRALAHRNARRLSGGERQRAFIAMALAQGAGVLLLDEPTTYLDVRAAHELMVLVRRLAAQRGMTVVAVLRDIDLALRFCDEVAVLGRERPTRLLAQGTPVEVAGGPALPAAFGVAAVPCERDGVRAYGLFEVGPPTGA